MIATVGWPPTCHAMMRHEAVGHLGQHMEVYGEDGRGGGVAYTVHRGGWRYEEEASYKEDGGGIV